jgi:hypothetical protein
LKLVILVIFGATARMTVVLLAVLPTAQSALAGLCYM